MIAVIVILQLAATIFFLVDFTGDLRAGALGSHLLAEGGHVRGIGLPGDDENPLGDALDELAERAEQAVNSLKGEARFDDTAVEMAVGRVLKKGSQQIWDRRPIVETVVLRL